MVVNREALYPAHELEYQKERYNELEAGFKTQFNETETPLFFSAPGRTEIGGNHTDHNRGHVLAAATNLDIAAAAIKTCDNVIYLKSKEYPDMDIVDLTDLSARPKEEGKASALIRGICAKCVEKGFKVGGFKAYTMTDVLKGSGLSSSAAFENVIVTMLSHFYNEGDINPVDTAVISQYAENVYFGKPCGVLDQMASSVGGLTAMDFKNPESPVITKIEVDLKSLGYVLFVVDTGGNHADLTSAYAEIPQEMQMVAHCLGKNYLSETSMPELIEKLLEVREKTGDRAILRAMHFFDEDKIAIDEAKALKNADMTTFLSLVNKSGLSSETRLQNVFANVLPREQGISLGLALSKKVLGKRGASRVHGGGFAGTMQAFVPLDMANLYRDALEAVFGKNSCYEITIRSVGGVQVTF